MPIKLAVIGAGSLGFTRGVVRDVLAVPEFADIEIAFTDVSERNLDMVYQLCKRDLEASGLPAKLTATTNRREAVAGANYVYSVVRVGGLEAEITMLATGGVTLGWHAEQVETQMALKYNPWDWVILQQKTHPFDGYPALRQDYLALAP